jgi:hypothetical protein
MSASLETGRQTGKGGK